MGEKLSGEASVLHAVPFRSLFREEEPEDRETYKSKLSKGAQRPQAPPSPPAPSPRTRPDPQVLALS